MNSFLLMLPMLRFVSSVLLALAVSAQPHGITSLAGGAGQCGAPGTSDGVGTVAGFESPVGVVQCQISNCTTLYVSDTGSHRIRTVDTISAASRYLAGSASGTPGYADGTFSTARFYNPSGLAVDTIPALYVADAGNNLVRKLLLPDNVTTFVGGGGATIPGFVDGVGTNALFYGPYALALWQNSVLESYFLFVLDAKNNAIRMIVTNSGTVSTIAGNVTAGYADGDGSSARFDFKSVGGLITDGGTASISVYVADFGNNVIRKVLISDPQSPLQTVVVSTIVGNPAIAGFADGVGTNALFNGPTGTFYFTYILAGFLMITEGGNNAIRQVDLINANTSTLTGAVGSGCVDGSGTAARFSYPTAVSSLAYPNYYVADSGNNKIRVLGPPLSATPTPTTTPTGSSTPSGTPVIPEPPAAAGLSPGGSAAIAIVVILVLAGGAAAWIMYGGGRALLAPYVQRLKSATGFGGNRTPLPMPASVGPTRMQRVQAAMSATFGGAGGAPAAAATATAVANPVAALKAAM